jgi:Uma2 family endonuclease
MNSLARRPGPHMTADDFLAWPGDGSGRTFQLVDGEVRAVSPASHTHAAIQARLAFLLWQAVEASGLPLQVVTEGAVIPGLNAATNVRVPDLLITATPDQRGQQAIPDPLLVVEVLSPGNLDDTRDNVRACATLPSVQEIAVLHSTRMLAEVHRRDHAGIWESNPEFIGQGEALRLRSAALHCALEDVYRGTWLTRSP